MKPQYLVISMIVAVCVLILGVSEATTAREAASHSDLPGAELGAAPWASIEGVVVDPLASGEGLQVDLLTGGRLVRAAQTGEAGEFYFGGLPEGRYSLRVLDRRSGLRGLADGTRGEVELVEGQRLSGLVVRLSDAAPDPAGALAPAGVQAYGQITGVVTAADTGLPLQSVYVTIFNVGGAWIQSTPTDPSGGYVLWNVAPGAYKVMFSQVITYGLEWYSGQSTFDAAAVVNVVSGAVTPNINANLMRGGHITGTVTAADTGLPMADVYIELYDSSGMWIGNGAMDAAGHYQTAALRSGSYRLMFSPIGQYVVYPAEYYNGKDTLDGADVVVVTAPQDRGGIDVALKRGSLISGRITAADTGLPMPGASATVYDCAGGRKGTWATADASGFYTMTRGLATGSYRVLFSPPNASPPYSYPRYLSETYNNRPNLASADLISVTAPNPVSNIDAVLDVGGTITGTVTASDTGLPLSGVIVSAYQSNGGWFSNANSDNSGRYVFTAVPSGSYRLRFRTQDYSPYINQFYHGQPNLDVADPVVVNAPNSVGAVDVALVVGAPISGPAPLGDGSVLPVHVQVYKPDGQPIDVSTFYSYTSSTIQTSGLPTGTYRVLFVPLAYSPDVYSWPYGYQYYDRKLDLASANDVAVSMPAGATIGAVTLTAGGHIAGYWAGINHSLWPAEYVDISVYNSSGHVVAIGVRQATNRYVTNGLPTGNYRVLFDPSTIVPRCGGPYLTQYYFQRADLASADAVPVTAPNTTDNINALLYIAQRLFLPSMRR